MPENIIEKMILELKDTDVPIYIWGGAKLAKKVKWYMENKGIAISGFLINAKYWEHSQTELCGYPLYILEDYLSEHVCNLVVAFDGYCEDQIEEYKGRIQGLYVIDFMGMLCTEEYDSSISTDFFESNKERLKWLEDSLQDEKSKIALNEYLMQKISGTYTKGNWEMNQYFPDDIICLQEQETFVNCGAYHGEDVVTFIECLQNNKINEYKKIICIEADKENCSEMKEVLSGYKNVEIISAGVWDKDGTLYMNAGHGRSSCISRGRGGIEISVKAIDNILMGQEVTYIKMDIEGSELKALHGAAESIKKYKPKLAICIYHKPEDLIEIPQYIQSLRGDYKFFIRNHNPHAIETVLYAV